MVDSSAYTARILRIVANSFGRMWIALQTALLRYLVTSSSAGAVQAKPRMLSLNSRDDTRIRWRDSQEDHKRSSSAGCGGDCMMVTKMQQTPLQQQLKCLHLHPRRNLLNSLLLELRRRAAKEFHLVSEEEFPTRPLPPEH